MLRMLNISKAFPGVLANERITFDVAEREIHGLLGENGSGKTTLMNILYGLYRPDDGKIYIKGREVTMSSPAVALQYGIGMVHQHSMLIPTLSVVENVLLASSMASGWLELKRTARRIQTLAESYGFKLDPWEKVDRLPLGAQQRVEILKALFRGTDLLILDEPTSMLTPGEVHDLFRVLRKFRAEGRSVIFISHKLHEILDICDRVTVLRDGKVVGTQRVQDTSTRTLAEMMVGREIVFRFARDRQPTDVEVLRVDGLRVADAGGREHVKGISFAVRSGEIFGFVGVDGNGQSELAAAIGGLVRPSAGTISLLGVDVTNAPVRKRLDQRLSHIPEDRLGTGLVVEFGIADNIVLRDVRREPFTLRGVLNAPAISEHSAKLCVEFGVKAPLATKVRQLSGGNQQRVVLARELVRQPRFLLAVQPTRGLDVRATEYVLHTIITLRAQGVAILYISMELEEVLGLSDRIAVLFDGCIMGVRAAEDVDVQEIGLMMAGVTQSRPQS